MRTQGYSEEDIIFLNSIESVSSIAVKNSRLYEKAYEEARTDELTGLLNRKYFCQTLEENYEKCRRTSLALVIFNVDDFKLYNQLYGNHEGDKALVHIARIIQGTVGITDTADATAARNLPSSCLIMISIQRRTWLRTFRGRSRI